MGDSFKLFQTLLGLKGELAAFRILELLFNNDKEFKKKFLSVLFNKLGWSDLGEHPCGAMNLEKCIAGSCINDGRIDAVITDQTRDRAFVIAIEGKFWAEFQQGQLPRYGDWLIERSEPRKGLIVIVPDTRFEESERHLVECPGEIKKAVVTWQELSHALEPVLLPTLVGFIATEWFVLLDYLLGNFKWGEVPDKFEKGSHLEMKNLLDATYPLFTDDRYQLVDRQPGRGGAFLRI